MGQIVTGGGGREVAVWNIEEYNYVCIGISIPLPGLVAILGCIAYNQVCHK